ncbi:MAG: tetratricopeptide repeat protein [Endomicrobiales bacterium]
MNKFHRTFLSILVIFSLMLVSGMVVSRQFPNPYPPLKISPLERYAVLDMSGVLAGARRIAADIAWIQLLQYYGSPEKPLDKETEFRLSWDMTRYLAGLPAEEEEGHEQGHHEDHEPGHHEEGHSHPAVEGGVYPDFLSYCRRVTGLDPFFSYAYLYGAGTLAWNLNRPEEAMSLLKQGILTMEKYRQNSTQDIHQPFWQYHLYLSAILYRQSGEDEKMTALLEAAVKQPQCPNMVKAILANIYQKADKAPGALNLWLEIYDSGDPSYREKAVQKIDELKTALKL